jgi:hypothetical protein
MRGKKKSPLSRAGDWKKETSWENANDPAGRGSVKSAAPFTWIN